MSNGNGPATSKTRPRAARSSLAQFNSFYNAFLVLIAVVLSTTGVYRMLNVASEVLYVGKARNLRARVSSYARPSGHSGRIARMISETASMMFLTTRTETEALLLEQNLIKQLKPRYNVLLRDDKSFPNILIPTGHPFPMLKDQALRRALCRQGVRG